MHQLSSYSAQCLAALQYLLPDLAALAVSAEGAFLIRTTSPSGLELWISSAEQELTVGFAEHHAHFGWHEGYPQEDAAVGAECVQGLRTGKLVVVAWYKGMELVSSTLQEVGQPVSPPTWFQRWRRRKQQQVVRRWA